MILYLPIILVIALLVVDRSFAVFGHAELHRKLAHILGGMGMYWIVTHGSFWEVLTIGLILTAGLFLLHKWKYLAILNYATKSNRGLGEWYFALAIILLFGISSYMNTPLAIKALAAGILVVTFADGLAPFGGYLWGKPLYQSKTFGGTSMCAFITFLIGIFYIEWSIIPALLFAIIIAVAELFSKKGIDNLVLPLITFGMVCGLGMI